MGKNYCPQFYEHWEIRRKKKKFELNANFTANTRTRRTTLCSEVAIRKKNVDILLPKKKYNEIYQTKNCFQIKTKLR